MNRQLARPAVAVTAKCHHPSRRPLRCPLAGLVWWLATAVAWGLSGGTIPVQGQTILPIPTTAPAAPADNGEDPGEVPAPTDDNPEATAAETPGTIEISPQVTDDAVRDRLCKLLPQYPGVRSIEVEVEEGVVTLRGHVENDNIRDRLRDFVRRVQGVNLVLNKTKTDQQVLSATELANRRIQALGRMIAQKWLVVLGGLGILVFSLLLTRIFWRISDRVVTFLTDNMLLRSVLASVIGGSIVLTGILTGLWVMGVADTVLPGLGLAGVVALAVSFAFRDIAENFVASIMLGTRRPFRVGDFVEVDGKAGVVKALNTRSTQLVTLDGHLIRIPNATVFKSTIINRTASKAVRGLFDVLLPYDSSISQAQTALAEAVAGHEAVLDDPPPRAMVEALEPGGVRLRVSYWYPPRDVDGTRLQSDARFLAKVALQKLGIQPAQSSLQLSWTMPPPGLPFPGGPVSTGTSPAATISTEAAAVARQNLAEDSRVAAGAASELPEGGTDELQHALDVVAGTSGDEGRNLLQGPAAP
ncbi:MAG: mechanosensitive ion channel family protein [Planctomycetaceae bacterium]